MYSFVYAVHRRDEGEWVRIAVSFWWGACGSSGVAVFSADACGGGGAGLTADGSPFVLETSGVGLICLRFPRDAEDSRFWR